MKKDKKIDLEYWEIKNNNDGGDSTEADQQDGNGDQGESRGKKLQFLFMKYWS